MRILSDIWHICTSWFLVVLKRESIKELRRLHDEFHETKGCTCEFHNRIIFNRCQFWQNPRAVKLEDRTVLTVHKKEK